MTYSELFHLIPVYSQTSTGSDHLVRNVLKHKEMDLRKKTDSLGTSFNVKTEYIEEDVENVMKNDFSEIQTPSVVSTIPPSRYLGQHSPQAPEGAAGHMFTPFTHPFYHPISAFSFVSLPPSLPAPVSYPTFRDVLESNHNESYNYKRKSPSSIRDANKKLKEKSPESNNHQEKQEKEKDTKHEESSGKIKNLKMLLRGKPDYMGGDGSIKII